VPQWVPCGLEHTGFCIEPKQSKETDMSESNIRKKVLTAIIVTVLVIASVVGVCLALPVLVRAINVTTYQTDHHTMESNKDEERSSERRSYSKIESYDADNEHITMYVKLEYSTNKDAVPALCTRYGSQFDFEKNFLIDELTNAVRETTVKHTMSEMVSKMISIQDEVRDNLSERLSDLGVTVDRIVIKDIY
jgi:flagellar basal body-associated protein FliL